MERMKSDGGSSSIRRRSLSMSSHRSHHTDNDIDIESVSEAGDIGDRALPSKRFSESNSFHSENGGVELQRLHPNSSIIPLPHEVSSTPPLSTDAVVGSEDSSKLEHPKGLPVFLDYVSCMAHLAVFGILGVLTRYLLQKLFGPEVANVTSNHTILYPDLPSNMIGSFFMGWFGVEFKKDISHVSEHLAIAITTGYLGSLTTFSGWNQKMLELSASGRWVISSLGFLIGLTLVVASIAFGIETAKGFRWLLNRLNITSSENCITKINCKVDSYHRQLTVMVMFLVILAILWGVSGALVKAKFKNGGSAAELWLACLVGPIGVWIRWFLARLNGRGLGKEGLMFKWMPFGTLIANVSAACVMAALSTIKNVVNTRNCDTVVAGIQLGVMGCLSTVSTFAAEFNKMKLSSDPWTAHAYAAITICVSFSFGILIYCIPYWTKGFDIDT
ncbi:fluoride export protein 1-like [Trifolium pratense]|uniref:fluoride export protein 1-like n=1 Tax=Trifolium pratense TaxID=57577 RepID=UPI001E694A25|nr:fluoride export protein 1-like [Trifolium pratense]XP_045803255.1 fluoride export protein 1-like [Trifolium pratense]XP_045803256.1 fluoride export protein 1-like [Trifolium pratense]